MTSRIKALMQTVSSLTDLGEDIRHTNAEKNAIGNRWNPVRLYEEELIKPRKALQAMTQVKSLKTLGKVEAMKPHKTLTKTK